MPAILEKVDKINCHLSESPYVYCRWGQFFAHFLGEGGGPSLPPRGSSDPILGNSHQTYYKVAILDIPANQATAVLYRHPL